MMQAGRWQWAAALAAFLIQALAATAGAADPQEPKLRNPLPSGVNQADLKPEKIKKDKWIAYRLAKCEWLDKVAEADPRIIAAITAHPGPAKLLAKHRHLDKIADSDPYLCRRLTQWKGATDKLCRHPYFDYVVAKDPAGMYYAMNRKPVYARVMARQMAFWQLNDLDRQMPGEIRKHMK